MITAKEAYKQASDSNTRKIQNQLKNIETDIKNAILDGGFSLTYSKMLPSVRKALEDAGYAVSYYSDIRDPDATYTVSWAGALDEEAE